MTTLKPISDAKLRRILSNVRAIALFGTSANWNLCQSGGSREARARRGAPRLRNH
jgi:hypothetical protein